MVYEESWLEGMYVGSGVNASGYPAASNCRPKPSRLQKERFARPQAFRLEVDGEELLDYQRHDHGAAARAGGPADRRPDQLPGRFSGLPDAASDVCASHGQHLSASDQEEITVRLRGASRSKKYMLTFDNSGETCEVSGYRLMNEGVHVRLAGALTSELILYQEI